MNLEIEVDREELLAKLVENRRQHVGVYELADVAYKELVVKKLEEVLERARAGEDVEVSGRWNSLSVGVEKPSNHAGDYDLAIAMVELATGTVGLDAEDFNHFWLDNWAWMDDFKVSLSAGKLCVSEVILADSGFTNYLR